MSLNIHPKNTKIFIGHKNEREVFENAFFNNSLHHAWLLEGPTGIGKTTFAYSAARSILSYNKEVDKEVSLFSDTELMPIKALNFNFDENNLIHNRISESTHVDLKVIERLDVSKSPYAQDVIPVNKVRELESFFSKTSGEGGWRIAIIDSLDNLNKHGSNSLLKILEEPPANCLILLISSNKANVLDTIRSRCRVLRFSSLNDDDTKLIIKTNSKNEDEEDLNKLNIISNGSPGKALMLYNNNGLEVYDHLINIFLKIPNIDIAIIDILLSHISSKKNVFGIKILNLLITVFLNRTYRRSLNLINLDISTDEKDAQEYFINNFNIADLPALWENIFTQINKTSDFNLDKKQAIINLIENIKKLKKK